MHPIAQFMKFMFTWPKAKQQMAALCDSRAMTFDSLFYTISPNGHWWNSSFFFTLTQNRWCISETKSLVLSFYFPLLNLLVKTCFERASSFKTIQPQKTKTKTKKRFLTVTCRSKFVTHDVFLCQQTPQERTPVLRPPCWPLVGSYIRLSLHAHLIITENSEALWGTPQR